MDITTISSIPSAINSNEWAERCAHWQNATRAISPKRKRRERRTSPLVLAGHGVSIRLNRGTLLISEGNTHFPGNQTAHRYFKGDLNLPPRIILLDGSGAITLDALDWIISQDIELIRLNWDGELITAIGKGGYSADRKLVAWQLETRRTEKKRVEFGLPLIAAKIRHSLENLQELLPPSPSREKAIEAARIALTQLGRKPPASVSQLLKIEGHVAAGYFFAWRALPIKWKALSRYPVPEDWKRFFSRSSLTARTRVSNEYATHPINAMLNYAYGVLEAKTRIDAVSKGYDPTIGILHGIAAADRPSFVLDLMEPKRPLVDRAIIQLVRDEVFAGGDFMVQRNGMCRVNPRLAACVAELTDSYLGAALRLKKRGKDGF